MLQEFVKFFINPVLQFFLLVLLFFKLKKPKKLLFGILIYFFFASIPLTGKLFHYFWIVLKSLFDLVNSLIKAITS